MAGMDRHLQIKIIEDGCWPDDIHPEFRIDHTRRRDKVTGCRYRVKVDGPTKLEYEWDQAGAMRLREAVKGRPGLHVHFSSWFTEYCGKMSTAYDLKFRGRISKRSHEEALTPLINLGGIPLAARDEIIVLVFSQYDDRSGVCLWLRASESRELGRGHLSPPPPPGGEGRGRKRRRLRVRRRRFKLL